MADEPGLSWPALGRIVFASAASFLVWKVLQHTIGRKIDDFAERKINPSGLTKKDD